MNSSLTTPAIVLRRADWRDYDRMVTLFTPEHGRIDAVVRGCRKPKSPLLNAAEPFCAGEYQLLRVKDRVTVTQARITNGFFELRSDYDRLLHGAFWLKLLSEVVVEDEPNEALFRMTLDALAYLTHSELPAPLLTAMFEMQLWRLTGFSPNVLECVVCRTPSDKTALRFDAQKGGCVCAFCAPGAHSLSEAARRILMKAPRTPYSAVEKLAPREEWPEAACRIREFTLARVGNIKNLPELQAL
ncbi:MAG: DNA repair protein RecO [Clostridia bacterium]|nr:DNA repair protein RecO [Clostridia bacterium]